MAADENAGAGAYRETRMTITRLLKAAAWSIDKFEQVQGEMSGPLAILEAGKRCVDMALKLQEFEQKELQQDGGGGSTSDYTVNVNFLDPPDDGD